MRSISHFASYDSKWATDDAQKFFIRARNVPRTCPAQPPANIPGASGKMLPPEKKSRNEKLKSLNEAAIAQLNHLLNLNIQNDSPLSEIADQMRTLHILTDFIDVLIEPEEPE